MSRDRHVRNCNQHEATSSALSHFRRIYTGCPRASPFARSDRGSAAMHPESTDPTIDLIVAKGSTETISVPPPATPSRAFLCLLFYYVSTFRVHLRLQAVCLSCAPASSSGVPTIAVSGHVPALDHPLLRRFVDFSLPFSLFPSFFLPAPCFSSPLSFSLSLSLSFSLSPSLLLPAPRYSQEPPLSAPHFFSCDLYFPAHFACYSPPAFSFFSTASERASLRASSLPLLPHFHPRGLRSDQS
jgi:hypothetical protein